MKSMFSQLLKVSAFNQLKRFVIVAIVLSNAVTLKAGIFAPSGFAHIVATAVATPTGSGKVYVGLDSNGTAVESTCIFEQRDPQEGTKKWTSKPQFTFYFKAEANEGYDFSEWQDENQQTKSNNKVYDETRQGETSDLNKTISIYRYAIFKPIISVDNETTWQNEKTITITKRATESASVTSTIYLYNATGYTISNSTGSQNITFTPDKTTPSTSGADQVKITITAAAAAQSGETATITFTSTNNGGTATINVEVETEAIITFNPPKVVGAQYTTTQTNAAGNAHTLTSTSDPYPVTCYTQDEKFFTLLATAPTGYRFYRWVITNGSNAPRYVYDNPYSYGDEGELKHGDEVTVEYISSDYAQFLVINNNSENVLFNNLQLACDYATTVNNKNVIVYTSGRMMPGEYTIPAGVTLLVPGDGENNYTIRNDGLVESDFLTFSSEANFLAARKQDKCLSLDDNTTINVNGNICVFAKLSGSMGSNAAPVIYGRLDMRDNCHIILNGGARLSAFGFITGNPATSSIIAKAGSVVYEAFQLRDWRGGAATLSMLNNSQDVLPIGQYYIQNIETKLQLQYGARENITMLADMSMGKVLANQPLIAYDEYSSPTGVMFRLGKGCSFEKYYDPLLDRLHMDIVGVDKGATASIENIEFTTSFGVGINTSDYVLPFNMNMDIAINNAVVSTEHDVALLAGATLSIASDASLIIETNAFVYDKDQHGNYFGASNSPLLPVYFSPTKVKTRTAGELTDTRIDVNGLITVKGGFYTTSSGADITSSEGGGQVYFVKKGTKPNTSQVKQKENSIEGYITIPVTNAQLHNADGSYSAGDAAANGDRYIYYKDIDGGKWTKPKAAITNPTLPELLITMPTVNSESDELVCTLTKPDEVREYQLADFKVSSNNPQFTIGTVRLEGNKLYIPIIYTAKHEHGEYSATITVANTASAVVTLSESINISATEDYTPIFTTAESCNIASTIGVPQPASFPITPADNNVTTLLGDDKIQWSKEIVYVSGDNEVFRFDFGTDANYLSQAKVTFTPLTAVTSTAKLRLTATCSYVAAGQEPLTLTKEITLTGNASLNDNNLQFAELPTLFVGMTNIPLFANMGNHANAPTYITFEPANQSVVDLSGDGSNANPFVINATAAGEITITATQTATTSHKGADISKTIQVLPGVQWNWNTLYYGSTHTNPITTSAADWTLELAPDNAELCNEYVQLSKVDGQYQATILNSPTLEDCTAGFIYTVNGEELHFTSTLSGLRHITACVDNQPRYEAMCLNAENTTFSAGCFTFNSTTNTESKVTLQFVGTPKSISFTPNGTNKWNVEESANTQDWNRVVAWTEYADNQQVVLSLLPTTRYVRISYGAGSNSQGTLQNVCIQKLDVTTANSKIYLPIPGNQTIVFTHTGDAIITQPGELTINSSTTQVFDGYSQTSVNISATSAGTYTFTATQGTANEVVTVVAYDFPQGLPIKTAEWTEDAKDKYYFYTTETQYVAWNENNQRIILQNPAANEARSMTFAFVGAPSIISFEYSQDITSAEWTVEESINGIDWVTAKGNRTVSGTSFLQELQYTTRYVRLQHKGSWEETYISNLIIEGYPQILINPEELVINEGTKTGTFTITAINLKDITLELNSTDFQLSDADLTSGEYSDALGINKVGDIIVTVTWVGRSIVNDGLVTIKNKDGGAVLGYVKLLGAKSAITKNDANQTGIWTGVPDGKHDEAPTKSTYTLQGAHFAAYEYQPVDVTNAFMNTKNGEALFDYLFIYGETTTVDGATTIATPTSEKGSNAKTPYYIYKKGADGVSYEFVEAVENANSANKTQLNFVDAATTTDDEGHTYYSIKPADDKTELSIYITGFCPYATTGCTKYDEGVWYIQGEAGEHVHLYLEDCHIYSRNKTENGNAFVGRQGSAFTEGYVRGSGGVFVVECLTRTENIAEADTFNVTIHTRGHNVLKSNYGSFFNLMGDLRAFQVSSPIQVHLASDAYVNNSKVTLNFDDIWQVANTDTEIDYIRTNGFLSLQKQVNNAPSIDLGNEHTTVNFYGGRVELQNAAIVSTNYKTTLAISHRSGTMGAVGLNILLAYGMGTDAAGGTVNFYDGTTSVIPMTVPEEYRGYYLMDTDAEGKELATTSCLRCPKQTYVYGGSHGMLRACRSVTSRGGAPTDGPGGKPLGKYEYTLITPDEGVTDEVSSNGLAIIRNFPNNALQTYYSTAPGYLNQTYGLQSVSPIENKLYFWIPEGYDYEVKPEKDATLTTWRTCMTEISASYAGKSASIGGDLEIESDEVVKYLLYCQIDENIHDVISKQEERENVWEDENNNGVEDDGEVGTKMVFTYEATVKDPTGQLGGEYFSIRPTGVGSELQNSVTNEDSYQVTDRVYYITTAKADTWMNFTAPFDVENIYVMETFNEDAIRHYFDTVTVPNDSEETKYTLTAKYQAKHNADFAAFFAMAMALGSDKPFEDIYDQYIDWAMSQDGFTGSRENYVTRGKTALVHYDGSNFPDAHFYLYRNDEWEDWETTDMSVFQTQWQVAPAKSGNIMLEKGTTYSMLFPYSLGVEMEERTFWDYWTGKFLIFESTLGNQSDSHEIYGREEAARLAEDVAPGHARLSGNKSFAQFNTEREDVYLYSNEGRKSEEYIPNEEEDMFDESTGANVKVFPTIEPTTTFLIVNIESDSPNSAPIRRILRTGEIIYGTSGNGTTTGGNMPTVGGGNDLFITSIAGGINIAVAAPQYVRVLSSTGALLFSGMVQTSVDVTLPANGVYVIAGENEVQKILY